MAKPTIDRDAAFYAIRGALMASYSGTLASTRMAPLEALEALAAALGSVYREVADAHIDPQGCPCGWVPDAFQDIVTLMRAMEASASAQEGDDVLPDLYSLAPVGHG